MQPDAETTKAPRKRSEPKYSPDQLRQLFERTGVEPTVDTDEAAALLDRKSQTLRRWACNGDGPITPRRINGRLRWSIADIRAIVSGVAA